MSSSPLAGGVVLSGRSMARMFMGMVLLEILSVLGQAQSGELPARLRGEEVAVARAHVSDRGGARTAAQHPLPAHELAVVLAKRAGQGTEARIGDIGRGGPFPRIAVHLRQARPPGRLRW